MDAATPPTAVSPVERTDCCIAGGGPAGLMLGYLLARAGVHVIVLEKHLDFLRDFRGDTIHPSTLTVLDDLGLLDAFLALPHQEVTELTADIFGQEVTIADFRHIGASRPFMALVQPMRTAPPHSCHAVRACVFAWLCMRGVR